MTVTRPARISPPARASVAAAAGALLLAPTLIRPRANGPVLCPLRRMTGVWCPTCGLTRAMGWLVHGNIDQALQYHPVAPVLLIECVIAAAVWGSLRRARRDGTRWPARWVSIGRGLIVANAALLLVVWAIRLKLGSFDDLS
jgi:hypothetical protein